MNYSNCGAGTSHLLVQLVHMLSNKTFDTHPTCRIRNSMFHYFTSAWLKELWGYLTALLQVTSVKVGAVRMEIWRFSWHVAR